MKIKALILLSASCLLGACDLKEPDDFGNECTAQGHDLCSGSCMSLMTHENCGACGKRCSEDESCELRNGLYGCFVRSKECIDPEQRYCGAVGCVHIDTREHCGGCGSCRTGENCVKDRRGSYICQKECKAPNYYCNGNCVQPSNYNCGACGIECQYGEYCTQDDDGVYTCKKSCELPHLLCDGECHPPDSIEHCGVCNNSCKKATTDCMKDGETYRCVDKCANGIRDEGETGVDCGGRCTSCKPCRSETEQEDCGPGGFCDSAIGFLCSKRCEPDNGVFNTPSKHCPGIDRICRADGRCSSKYFIMQWQARADTKMILPHFQFLKRITCDFEIDWGDGQKEHFICGQEGAKRYVSHTYTRDGLYTVKLSGSYDNFGWGNFDLGSVSSMALNIRAINAFGPIGVSHQAFRYADNLSVFPVDDIPDATKLTDMDRMFYSAVGTNLPVENWDTRHVTTMLDTFVLTDFNRDIGKWDVSKVKKLRDTFSNETFNQDLSSWNLSPDVEMNQIFGGAISKENYCKMWKSEKWKALKSVERQWHDCAK